MCNQGHSLAGITMESRVEVFARKGQNNVCPLCGSMVSEGVSKQVDQGNHKNGSSCAERDMWSKFVDELEDETPPMSPLLIRVIHLCFKVKVQNTA